MGMAQGGVLLVIDPNVMVTSRIWVCYELFRTIRTASMMDIAIYDNGDVHLIADKDLPSESPYQKNRREQKFPFENICSKFLALELYRGNASKLIDKVRILNVMIANAKLDDDSVLKRIQSGDSFNPKYLEDMEKFLTADAALRAEMATKAVSVALSNSGQSLRNFYGFDLVDIITTDKLRTELIFDDLLALDGVTDEVCSVLLGMVTPDIKKLVFNINGCRNITKSMVLQLELPNDLSHLDLNIGYARNIENDVLLHLATVIPPKLKFLALDVSGYKTPDGSYVPMRYNNHLEHFAANMPPDLESYSLVTNLESKDGEGLNTLVKSFPPGLKEFSIVIHQWDGFRGNFFTDMAENLPPQLEKISIKQYNGEHFEDEDLKCFAAEIKKLENLKEFYLHTRSTGRKGYYEIRTIESVADILSYV